MIQREESLAYHKGERPGKIELRATKPCLSPRDMRLAYLPGASFPSQEITKNQQEVFNYTSRGNLIGLITNGSAVPGLGNVGPKAAKPMMEGLAILYKRLADIEVFDLELNVEDPDSFVKTVETLESTFGAISLKDLRAPDGLYIFDRLREIVPIPIYHENLYSTAVVAMAALSNALELVEKTVEGVKIVICGAGTVGIGCARLLRSLGANPDNIFLYDINGLIHPDRDDLDYLPKRICRFHIGDDAGRWFERCRYFHWRVDRWGSDSGYGTHDEPVSYRICVGDAETRNNIR